MKERTNEKTNGQMNDRQTGRQRHRQTEKVTTMGVVLVRSNKKFIMFRCYIGKK